MKDIRDMGQIEKWRRNAVMTRAQMASEFEIPVRTLENWDAGTNNPPAYVEKLIVEKLMQLTEKNLEERAGKRMAQMPSDKEGRRPVGSWAVISSDGNNEFIDLYDGMTEAVREVKGDGTKYEESVAYIICNQTEGGLEPWYEDEDGNIHGDYDSIDM